MAKKILCVTIISDSDDTISNLKNTIVEELYRIDATKGNIRFEVMEKESEE